MIIRREAMLAALAATTDEDTRYYLDGISCEPDANRVIGTNGHVLLIATDRNPFPDAEYPSIPGAEFHGNPATPATVPSGVCRSMLATMPKKSKQLPILACTQLGRNGSDSSVTLAATDLEAPRVATIETDGKQFPPYARCLPNAARASVEVVLGIEVLETLIKAAKAIAGTGKKASIPSIRFDVPIGRKDRKENPIKDPETGEIRDGKPGMVIAGLGVTIIGADVTITGVAMPMRI